MVVSAKTLIASIWESNLVNFTNLLNYFFVYFMAKKIGVNYSGLKKQHINDNTGSMKKKQENTTFFKNKQKTYIRFSHGCIGENRVNKRIMK